MKMTAQAGRHNCSNAHVVVRVDLCADSARVILVAPRSACTLALNEVLGRGAQLVVEIHGKKERMMRAAGLQSWWAKFLTVHPLETDKLFID